MDQHLTVARRIGLGFLVVVLAMVAVVGVAVVKVASIEDHLAVINDENAVKQRHAMDWRGSVHDRAIALRDVVLAPDAVSRRREVTTIDALAADYRAAEAPMAALFAESGSGSAAEREALAEIDAVQSRTLPLIDEVVELSSEGRHDDAARLLAREAKPAFVEWLGAINAFLDVEADLSAAETASARDEASGFFVTITLLFLLAVAVALVAGWRTTRTVVRPLAEARAVLADVATGDLTRRIEVGRHDEVGAMATSVNIALDSMAAVIGDLSESARRLGRTSDDVGSVAAALGSTAAESSTQATVVAAAAEEVSRNVSTVAAGAEQMGASIREIAHSANEAARVASLAVASVE
ncbi:MCP four helix bundle domain-containing protein, partial [Nocardioides pantholopis]|uniref:MCP four helix bundle domain-containing protein n=1 Tax=Nocardioides pantholopis TaxID=2483798 RepID=UPI0013E40628